MFQKSWKVVLFTAVLAVMCFVIGSVMVSTKGAETHYQLEQADIPGSVPVSIMPPQ